MENIMILIPLVIYLAVMLFIAYKTNEIKHSGEVNFIEEYFIGSRNMGGFVLAMTLIATYASASSFVGGPGVAYKLGLGWVLLACIQTPTAFLTLGILGKKFAIISRKIGAVTITDYLRARYKSDTVVILSSIAVLVFFAASIIAQFIGGARLFETVTGLSYHTGLLLFGVVVIIYTTLGGFRAVALTDAIQGIMMMVATTFLFFAILKNGGGMENIMQGLLKTNPDLLTPTSGGAIAKPFILSFWMLVGVAVLGLPQTTIRCMGFRDSKSMHRAMMVGTFVVGFLMIGMHLIGVMGAAVAPGIDVGDKIIPTLALRNMPPILAGVFIGGPLAATMSTVDSMLILSSAAIVKDLYIHYINKDADDKKIKKLTLFTSLTVGIIVFLLSMNPPKLLVWINLFAFGGLEATFLCPIVLGLYWKKANSTGAIASMLTGVGSYFYFTISKIKPMGMHQIVPVIFISLMTFTIGSLIGKKPEDEVLEIFF
ncbi:sodium/pantothenate symporter [uncultured Ilyobacter sp.]|uniref:sodium/pantothenate symporter n=1 Tax=uncultured Ilyobacter sp. TaxID=544433 RepID=UPI0029F58373|nr:sodium/pantothenate symporter [uncultured Ilyobacter sp.]